MKKIYIFGAGVTGTEIYDKLSEKMQVLGFLDNNHMIWGKKIKGVEVLEPKMLTELSYDAIIVGANFDSATIIKQLGELGVPFEKIDFTYVNLLPEQARIQFVTNYAELHSIDKDVCIAEAGVFKGDFAKELNKIFHNQTLYLFDTFEGFHDNDFEFNSKDNQICDVYCDEIFANTSETIVLAKMLKPEMCIIKKGYFPDTTSDIDSETKFFFVNLDMDLYKPTLNGLYYFCDKMISGGCILIHDYFSNMYSGAKEAVDEFSKEKNMKFIPIGDSTSVAIVFD